MAAKFIKKGNLVIPKNASPDNDINIIQLAAGLEKEAGIIRQPGGIKVLRKIQLLHLIEEAEEK